MNAKFDYLAFIGRFQPFHNGHYEVLQRALSLAGKVVVVLGSARRPRTIKDPWNIAERQVMVSACFDKAVRDGRLLFASVVDRLYNDQQWAAEVQAAVEGAIAADRGQDGPPPRVGIIGHEKDHSSFYLRLFPQWERVHAANAAGLSATEIRGYYLKPDDSEGNRLLLRSALPEPVAAFLEAFREAPYYANLAAEHAFIADYKAQFAGLKYPPIFQTVDAVVVQAGHLLLVQRKALPGAGLWALPGGFLQADERCVDGCLRELKEETRLKVPLPVLKGGIRGDKRFDHPERSLRGRTITEAFLIELEPTPEGLYPVRGGDDAAKARWVPIAQVLEMDEQMFEDHLDIIRYFLGQL